MIFGLKIMESRIILTTHNDNLASAFCTHIVQDYHLNQLSNKNPWIIVYSGIIAWRQIWDNYFVMHLLVENSTSNQKNSVAKSRLIPKLVIYHLPNLTIQSRTTLEILLSNIF
ncbi:hypothetical protein CR513_35576, partial [Mucuna pruriens]